MKHTTIANGETLKLTWTVTITLNGKIVKQLGMPKNIREKVEFT